VTGEKKKDNQRGSHCLEMIGPMREGGPGEHPIPQSKGGSDVTQSSTGTNENAAN